MRLAKVDKAIRTKRTPKGTTQTVATTPMTCAEALEAGRRAYEAAAGSTCAAAPPAELRPAPVTMRTRHDEAVPGSDDTSHNYE